MGKLCNILKCEKNYYKKNSGGKDRGWELQLTILNGVVRVSLFERITSEQRCERDKPCNHLGKHPRPRDRPQYGNTAGVFQKQQEDQRH